MCGIIGYVGTNNASDVLLNGLKRLEYRGYDSAGIAISDVYHQKIIVEKTVGKLENLAQMIAPLNLKANSGIGHTRWATHGSPNVENAHPHSYGQVHLVHNGIIENYQPWRKDFIAKGHIFKSTTDTEVAAHLLDTILKELSCPIKAIARLSEKLNGAFAFSIMIESIPERLYFIKKGSPLIVAKSDNGNFLASDQSALIDYDVKYYALKDGEYGYLSKEEIKVFGIEGHKLSLSYSPILLNKENVSKEGFEHFMHKEIFEQPLVLDRVLVNRVKDKSIDLNGFDIDFNKLKDINKIHIVACGSSFFAGLSAKSYLESLLRIPVDVEIASEYRYRSTISDQRTLLIAISQSGETADTLAAVEKAIDEGAQCLAICNVVGSAIARVCTKSLGNVFLGAGPEISVASTKAFFAQIIAIKLLTLALAKSLNRLSIANETELVGALTSLKPHLEQALSLDESIKELAKNILDTNRMLYLARGDLYPVAYEGALKMKELSYICAEGYPAGELKHGPIATIEQNMPAVVIFGNDSLQVKTASNLQEIKARGAKIISIAPRDLLSIKDESDFFIPLDCCHPFVGPVLATIPLQLLAYHLACQRGFDVDKPRNLAKSVTVE